MSATYDNYNTAGHVCPDTKRRAVTVTEYVKLADEPAAWRYDSQAAACGLDPWRQVDGVDMLSNGTACDIWYADERCASNQPLDTIVYVQQPKQPKPWPHANQIKYTARFGTRFKAHKQLDKVDIERKPDVDAEKFAADCIEFGGWHGTAVHADLVSFQGYDTLACSVHAAKEPGPCRSTHQGFQCSLMEGHAGAHVLGSPYRPRLRWVTQCPNNSCDYHQNSSGDVTPRIHWHECIKCGHMKP